MCRERFGRPRSAPPGGGRPTCGAGRRAFGGRRIRAPQAPTADPQSVTQAVTQAACLGPYRGRVVCAHHAPEASDPVRDRGETLNAVETSSSLDEAEVSPVFSSTVPRKPGPKGPGQDVIAVVEMKRRNPTWGCPRIAQQIALAFGIAINKDVVRRIHGARSNPAPDLAGPSWLTVLGHAKDSLWSLDLFRCESAVLRTHWVLVVMDQYTRRIVGFGVQSGVVDGVALCRMFNRATCGHTPPTYVSTDHDPLYR